MKGRILRIHTKFWSKISEKNKQKKKTPTRAWNLINLLQASANSVSFNQWVYTLALKSTLIMHTNYGMAKKKPKNFRFCIPVYFTAGRQRFYPGKSLLQHYIFPWKLQQKYYWKNEEHQWPSDENSAVYSNIKYVLKRQRKMQLLIITYHKGNSEPGCHQWQCSHFSHLRLQLQILPVKMKEKNVYNTHFYRIPTVASV